MAGKVSATPEKYLKDTVVYLKEVPGQYAPKTHAIDQKGWIPPAHPHPHRGDSVKFLNSDRVDHNVYTPDGDTYNLGVFPKGSRASTSSTRPAFTPSSAASIRRCWPTSSWARPICRAREEGWQLQIENVPPGTSSLPSGTPS